MSVEIASKQNILVTDSYLLKLLLVVFGFGSQAFLCGFSRQNICSVLVGKSYYTRQKDGNSLPTNSPTNNGTNWIWMSRMIGLQCATETRFWYQEPQPMSNFGIGIEFFFTKLKLFFDFLLFFLLLLTSFYKLIYKPRSSKII